MGFPYAAPRLVTELEDCYFYHTIELPGGRTMKGNWDLRGGLAEYLGHVDFGGCRVLDVGAANGLLSFFMEAQGAEVVSFDLDQNVTWDLVPFAAWADHEATQPGRRLITHRLNNAYWFGHRLLKSTARVVYGSVYDIPQEIGAVDMAVYGSILLHLRDPFLALQNGLRLTRETAIVVEPLHGQQMPTTLPYLGFLPDPSSLEPKDTWWDIRPETIVRMLGVLGFGDTKVTEHLQLFDGREILLYTVVGKRTSGRVM
jgi:hypothetical protein